MPEAKERLLEVQEVLGEREFGIGRFYYLRQSYPASIARLQSLVEKYPLYSRADEALFLLGQDYEGQIARLRTAPTCDAHGLPRGCASEALKARYIGELTKKASQAYSQIITRYPLMDRSDDARRRLASLHQPVPRPTKGAVARNRAEDGQPQRVQHSPEDDGNHKERTGCSGGGKSRGSDLADPEPVAATSVVRSETFGAAGLPDKGTTGVGVEVVKPDQPPADTGAAPDNTAPGGGSPFGRTTTAITAPGAADPNELKPTAASDPNELKPSDSAGDQALPPPPPQVNEIQSGAPSSSAAAMADNTPASDKDLSSSKKKKKGLKKVIPF